MCPWGLRPIYCTASPPSHCNQSIPPQGVFAPFTVPCLHHSSCNQSIPPQVGADSMWHEGKDDPRRREDSVSSAHGSEPKPAQQGAQDFVPVLQAHAAAIRRACRGGRTTPTSVAAVPRRGTPVACRDPRKGADNKHPSQRVKGRSPLPPEAPRPYPTIPSRKTGSERNSYFSSPT